MAGWAYYDAKGNRVSEETAVFRCKEAHVNTGVPAPASHASLAAAEYYDVHHIDQAELRKTFKSFHARLLLKRTSPYLLPSGAPLGGVGADTRTGAHSQR